MTAPKRHRRLVGIVGAGAAGLMAARTLQAAGHDTVLFDKGRSVGGRLATRRIGEARLDHGAQFFTARDPRFLALVEQWARDGVVREWCRGFDGHDGFPRYVATNGMNALAKHMASGLDVRCSSLVFGVTRPTAAAGNQWVITLDDASTTVVDALIMTCPIPQTFSLLFGAEVSMPETLWRTDYDRTLALLVTLDGPGVVPSPGGVQASQDDDPVFHFIGDNAAKGISRVSALTFHATAAWSLEHWEDDPATTTANLLAAAAPWTGAATVVEHQLKRWRFATPRSIWPDPYWSPDDLPTLAVAGDAFAGPKVEGAMLSGIAAAEALIS